MNNLSKNGKENFFPLTTMPSMHIAWSLLIFYFGFKICKKSLLFLIPYFILNFISTMYMLQHYTIDVFVGFIVGVVSILLANFIAKKQTPQFITNVTASIKQDLKNLFS